jgi:hypothetical protein
VDCFRFSCLCFVEEFQNLVPELVCLESWFRNLIIVKVSSFRILIPFGLVPTKVVPQNEIWQDFFFNGGMSQNSPSSLKGNVFEKGEMLCRIPISIDSWVTFLVSDRAHQSPLQDAQPFVSPKRNLPGQGGVF